MFGPSEIPCRRHTRAWLEYGEKPVFSTPGLFSCQAYLYKFFIFNRLIKILRKNFAIFVKAILECALFSDGLLPFDKNIKRKKSFYEYTIAS